jgi:hypothetical protein
MSAFNPLRAVGMIYKRGQPEPLFLGSCFSLRDSTAVVTAAHCIGDLEAGDLYVKMPWIIVMRGVNETDDVDGVSGRGRSASPRC